VRPVRLVVCFGTATEIGKTWMGAAILRELRRGGLTVAARKPAQSFDPADAHPTDAEVLAAATGEPPTVVCPQPWWLPVPLAPPMAAATLGRDGPVLRTMADELEGSWPDAAVDAGWVETVGGPRSPIAIDGDGVDLAATLRPDHLVLVADAALGTINAVRLSVDALAAVQAPDGLPAPVLVVLNRFDPAVALHRENLAWLRERCGLTVSTDAAGAAQALSGAVGP
jgi:dethiobiotin synthetase